MRVGKPFTRLVGLGISLELTRLASLHYGAYHYFFGGVIVCLIIV